MNSKQEEKALIREVLKKNGFNFSQQSLKGGYLMNQDAVSAAEKSCQEVLESERERIRKEIEARMNDSVLGEFRMGRHNAFDEVLSLLSPTSKPTT